MISVGNITNGSSRISSGLLLLFLPLSFDDKSEFDAALLKDMIDGGDGGNWEFAHETMHESDCGTWQSNKRLGMQPIVDYQEAASVKTSASWHLLP